MSDDGDEHLRDVLEEDERASIRGTLMQIGAQTLTRPSFKLDAYARECAIWIVPGMSRKSMLDEMDAKLGLTPHKDSTRDKVRFIPSGSPKVEYIEVRVGANDAVVDVFFNTT